CPDELIARFKEREENVRTDVVGCFSKLLETAYSSGGSTSRKGSAGPDRQKVAMAALKSKLGAIVKASDKQLKGKSHKTIVAVFQMLRTLCVVLDGGLDEHMPSLIASTHCCLQDKNQA
ncbi:unnamed protein product, partial [Hapterophycus canaliculatus]